ncbi:hypothetical protein LEP1GSC123_3662 [Leptospira borgpetersenii str. 200701203]|uniref:Uncharacterized protein n=1 Tax=Leptospira borgpetersenii str. 200701203 TaxID=1193007 RepID=M3HSL9_LEPBO|nr:hypothetical protein LEP1GSC123_3662 [Leptospira borgpetersenii str. 200701203]
MSCKKSVTGSRILISSFLGNFLLGRDGTRFVPILMEFGFQ